MLRLKEIIKIFGEILLILLVFFCLVFHELVQYGIMQGKGQMDIVLHAAPIEEIKDQLPDSVKAKLFLIQEIRTFAFEELGINYSDNYTTYYDQKGKGILWVLSAAEPYALKEYKWYFPFLGHVPYKGFFIEEKGLLEQTELAAAGYDTDYGQVSGWSTLGWFKDPVLSSMLVRKAGSLTNLIIHELTHGTLYVKDNTDFNENLASFIGDKGAIQFLKKRYGDDSEELKHYIQRAKDRALFNHYIFSNTLRLDSLYKSFKNISDVEKEKKKMKMINQIIDGLALLDFHQKENMDYLKKKILSTKNAYFLNFKLYDSQQDELENEFQEKFKGDLKAYLNYLKEKYPSL